MDRYHRKENKHKVSELKRLIFAAIFLISFWSGMIYAETQKEEEKKIELEKIQILGILERPSVLFPVRWKEPEAPEEKADKIERSFKEEIFDFGDVDNMGRIVK